MSEQLQPQPNEQPIDWGVAGALIERQQAGLDLAEGEQEQLKYIAENLTVDKPDSTDAKAETYSYTGPDHEGKQSTIAVDPILARNILNYSAFLDQNMNSVTSENSKIDAAKEEVSELEKEYEGAYSSLGNRHTYKVGEDGKKRVVSRDVAMAKADELNSLREIANPVEAELAEFGAPDASKRIDDLQLSHVGRPGESANPANPTIEKGAELGAPKAGTGVSNEDIYKNTDLSVDPTNKLEKPDASKRVDDLQLSHLSEVSANPTLAKGSALDAPSVEAGISAENIAKSTELAVDPTTSLATETSAPSLFDQDNTADDYENISQDDIKAIIARLLGNGFEPGEMTPIVTLEDVQAQEAVDAGTASPEVTDQVRVGRLRRIKNALMLVPAKMLDRTPRTPGVRPDGEVNEPMSRKKKVAIGVGGVAAVLGIAFVAHRTGVLAPTPKSNLSSDDLDKLKDVLGGTGVKPPTPDQLALDSLSQSLSNRTNEILSAGGKYPWSRASELYGDQAGARLISAVEKLQANGIDASWTADPMVDPTHAQIIINGSTDVNAVWNQLSEALAQQDIENFLSTTQG